VTALQQSQYQGRPDESGSAGDEILFCRHLNSCFLSADLNPLTALV
jgi:hypothetical protein